MTLVHTPWGAPQQQRELAPGIISVSTASHGGYWLSPERQAAMLPRLKDLNSYGGDCWYEEDCEWALVALSFPDLFDGQSLCGARWTLWRNYPRAYVALYAADRRRDCPACGGEGIAPEPDLFGGRPCCPACVPPAPHPDDCPCFSCQPVTAVTP